MECDTDKRSTFFSNLVLCGGIVGAEGALFLDWVIVDNWFRVRSAIQARLLQSTIKLLTARQTKAKADCTRGSKAIFHPFFVFLSLHHESRILC